MVRNQYLASDFGDVELIRTFTLQKDDAKRYFDVCIKPRFDRSYKLYVAYNGDRAQQIKAWQANFFVPYVNSVVETLMPRILDARPDFSVMGRTENDQLKAIKVQQLGEFSWEIAGMDPTTENLVRASMIYGISFLQASWKQDIRDGLFLQTKDISKKKLNYKKETRTFYDAPYAEYVDPYDLWYDWHNIKREDKQYWFRRRVIPGSVIKRSYPGADKKRLELALNKPGGDLTDFANIRMEVKSNHDKIVKNADRSNAGVASGVNVYNVDRYGSETSRDLRMYEVFEWWRPYEDSYAVMVNDVPILRGGSIPIPYDFKEAPFIEFPYLRLPNEFEGYGLPMLLENPQIMLNMIKNQRLDAVTLNIHKMWIVNPLANVNKDELVTRPFGIVYSADPNGVREIQFSDVKGSAYKEEELLKGDMRYASGVDDFSMGQGGGANSATEIRHLRESTLERVRLFVNHLGDGYATLLRYWISMYRQFFTDNLIIRITGDDGKDAFPLIEKDDIFGQYDYKATVMPSIAGKNDIDKKQGMDLFQLLSQLPFVDPKKLTSKVLHSWGWSLDSIVKKEDDTLSPDMAGMVGPDGMPVPGGELPIPNGQVPPYQQPSGQSLPSISSGEIPAGVVQQAIALLGGATSNSSFREASAPINLLKAGALPPTAPKIGGTTNPGGFNRGGKVNTNIPINTEYNPEANLLNRVNNIQR